MVSGQMVVMGSGDLSVAMRASMAVPGAFSPVVRGEQVLSDGGMVRNLPVDIARELCARGFTGAPRFIPPEPIGRYGIPYDKD
jgi:predicted acylesterase/phospholipase RssA